MSDVISDSEDVELLESLMTFLNSTYESGVGVIEDQIYLEDVEE